jgi:hypothetical protein
VQIREEIVKKPIEMDEGPGAFERFQRAVKAVLSVPKSALPPKPHRTPEKYSEMANVAGLVEPPKKRKRKRAK